MGLYYSYQPGKIQWIQGLAARIIDGIFDYMHSRGVDIVRSLNLPTVKERMDYFLCVLMFKFSPNYVCNDVTRYVDTHGYDTRSGEICIYTYPVSLRAFIREVFVTWLPIYRISYLPMLKNLQLLIHSNKIISIRKVGWNNIVRPQSTNHRFAVCSYICTNVLCQMLYLNVNVFYSYIIYILLQKSGRFCLFYALAPMIF